MAHPRDVIILWDQAQQIAWYGCFDFWGGICHWWMCAIDSHFPNLIFDKSITPYWKFWSYMFMPRQGIYSTTKQFSTGIESGSFLLLKTHLVI